LAVPPSAMDTATAAPAINFPTDSLLF